MTYSLIDRVYAIFIDVMNGVSSGSGNATFYNTDSHTSFIEVGITNGHQEFNMMDYSYFLMIKKPDGTEYRNELTAKDSAKLVITLDAQMLSSVGKCDAQLYVTKVVGGTNKVLTLIEFNYIVKEGSYSELAGESKDFDSLYVRMNEKLDFIIERGAFLTGEQATQLTTAYNHSQVPHAPADIVTTLNNKIDEAKRYADDAVNSHHKNVAFRLSDSKQHTGTDITVNPSKEGLTENLIVHGKTLHNIFPSNAKDFTLSDGVSINNGVISFKLTVPTFVNIWDRKNILYKENTKYTVVVDIYQNTLIKQGEGNTSDYFLLVGNSGGSNETVFTDSLIIPVGDGVKGRFVKTLTTKADFSSITNNYGARTHLTRMFSGGDFSFSIMILEGDYTKEGSYIPPYFEGIKNVGLSYPIGKNLFNAETDYTNQYVSSDGIIWRSTTNKKYSLLFTEVEEGQRYTVSGQGFDRNCYAFLDDNDKVLSYYHQYSFDGDYKTTTPSPKGATQLLWYLKVDGFDTAVDNKIQLEKGTAKTEYEPYKGATKNIIYSRGKNLFNKERDFTYMWCANNGIHIDDHKAYSILVRNISEGKYYCFSGQGYNRNTVGFLDKDYNLISIANTEPHSKGWYTTTPAPAGATMLLWYLKAEGFDTANTDYKIMVEEGKVCSEAYEPYYEDKKVLYAKDMPNGLMGLPNVSDFQYTDYGIQESWVCQNIDKTTFNGSEAWAWRTSAGGWGEFSDSIVFYLSTFPQCHKNSSFVCDKLCYYNASSTVAYNNNIGISNHVWEAQAHPCIRVKKTTLPSADVDGFKQWLSENPITVYYQLASPKYFKCSPTKDTNLKVFNTVTKITSIGDFKTTIRFALPFASITTDAKQYCDVNTSTSFLLPDTKGIENNNSVEIHLFVKVNRVGTLTFPSLILWDVGTDLVNIDKGSVVEFIFSYIKTEKAGMWLGTAHIHR